MKHEDAERRYAQIEGERDYYKRLADARAVERDASLEREQALVAHVGRMKDEWEKHDAIEVSMADKLELLVDLLYVEPADSLARRDPIKQAEALEDMVSHFRGKMPEPDKLCIIDAEIISGYASDLRQCAQSLK